MISMWRTGLAYLRLSNTLTGVQHRGLGAASFLLNKLLMKSVEHSPEQKMVSITWQNGTSNRYPYIYLRDNCRCTECFFEESSQRLLDIVKDVDVNVKLNKVEISDDQTKLSIIWPDGHISLLDAEWLFQKRLSEETESETKSCEEVTTRKVNLWGSEFKDHVPHMKFEDILNDEEVQFNWLNSLYRYGIALVTDTPVQEGQLEKLGNLVGYLRMTAYG